MTIDPRQIEVIDDQMAAIWREKSGAEKLRIASGLFDLAKQLIEASVRQAHPDWSELQMRDAIYRRLHGESN